MNRDALSSTGVALAGFAAVLIALHDGLGLAEPVRRVVSRADTDGIAVGAAGLAILAIGVLSRVRTRSTATG